MQWQPKKSESKQISEIVASKQEARKRLTEEKFSPVRGENFVTFIRHLLLDICKFPEPRCLEYLKHIRIFEQAFTSSTFDPECNYEALEVIGDSISNFCVVDYLTRRFPNLMHPNGKGVGVLSRLKINLISKTVFAQCAANLGFTDHIASDMFTRKEMMKDLLEDTFEAFNGALLEIAKLTDPNSDRKGFLPSLGPSYRIIMNYLDTVDISLKYEDLYDAKTRLKELIDNLGFKYHVVKYTQKYDSNQRIIFTARITIPDQSWLQGIGTGFQKSAAEHAAAEDALTKLKAAGYPRSN